MSTVKVASTFPAARLRASVVLLSLGLALLSALPVQAQPGPLTFFKNYFITGDYVVGGESLWRKGVNGRAAVQIAMSGVPEDVDILAAYLYVQTAEAVQWSGIDHATFNGADLGPGASSVAKALNWDLATAPCWTVNLPGGRRLVTYRADVLRYLPIGPNGRQIVNGPQTLEVPDSGPLFSDVDEGGAETVGGTGPRAVGASLVVVYRDPTKPFKAIVIYDGGFKKGAYATMTQTISGFYQASASPAVKMTHIVGDGRSGLSERVLFNDVLISTDPFVAADGPKWDNPTFDGLTLPGGAGSAAVKVMPNGLLSDCLCYSGIVFSTDVQDSDGDGLLDVWESSETPILDPTGQALPNLKAMGADAYAKDLFVEIGYMKTDTDATYGGVPKPAHSHLPTHAALKLVGDAFANAPTGRINVHFDVGDSYPPGDADPYIIPRGAGLARGGEAIDEAATVCSRGATDKPWVCQFSDYPGTVGWKSGFRFLRDQVFSVTPAPPATAPPTPLEDYCDVPGYTCSQRFDRNRKDMFRYALFAHALGLPKSEEPCLDELGAAVPPNVRTGRCDAPLRDNPDFHVPRTNTGVGDFPGADVMVTLGAFADTNGAPVDADHDPGTPGVWTPFPVGTPFMQASTLMHEMGHNMERRHGGEAFEPNCKPAYLSVMNYLYQLRGLLDDGGTPHLDFSRNAFAWMPTDETALNDGPLGGLPYRIGWYAPLVGSYLEGRGTAALRHCDGSDKLATDVDMVRIDARTAAGAIDWNADGDSTDSAFALDVNFNGRLDGPPSPPLAGSDDWSSIRLNQIGARRNTGGMYVADTAGHLLVGPLSLDSGRGDLGRGDLGRGDLGRGDLGRGDLGRGDLGRGDLGRGDLGRGDLGRGDLGRGDLGRGDLGGGDLFVGDPASPGGELDFETATDLAKTPPNQFTACVIGVNCSGSPLHAVSLGWTAPNVGGVVRYTIYRVAGDALVPDTPSTPWTAVGQVTSVQGQVAYALVDGTSLLNGSSYTYFAVATYEDGIQSDPSNLVTIAAVNDPPVADNDRYSTDEDTPLVQAAPGVLDGDADPDSTSTFTADLVTGPSHGTLRLNADGSFVYTPAANYYGADSFTYRASDGTVYTNTATVTLTVNAVNDAPVAGNDGYSTLEDTTLNLAAPGVLGNDTDVDGTLTAVLVTGPSHGTLLLNSDGSFTYTPAANYYGPDAFTYKASDGLLDSNNATVAITVTPVNDAPTISDIADRAIDANSNTGAVAFTIGDADGLTGLAVSGISSNSTLVPNANIVFAGTGASRTVTVTPAANQSGTATITVTVTDGAGLASSDSFLLTVKPVGYVLVNVKNLPPAAGVTFKPSSTGTPVDLDWKFATNGTVINSAESLPTVTVTGPGGFSKTFSPGAGCAAANGCASFTYKATEKTWDLDWKPKNAAVGTYYVVVTSQKTGQRFPETGLGFPVVFKQ